MVKYGIKFEPFPAQPGWLASPKSQLPYASLEEAVHRAHEQMDPATEQIFFGVLYEHNHIFHVTNRHVAEVAEIFQVGFNHEETPQTLAALRDLQTAVPFSPMYIETTIYIARFVQKIDRPKADKVLKVLDKHGHPGVQGYTEHDDPALDLVQKQILTLRWD